MILQIALAIELTIFTILYLKNRNLRDIKDLVTTIILISIIVLISSNYILNYSICIKKTRDIIEVLESCSKILNLTILTYSISLILLSILISIVPVLNIVNTIYLFYTLPLGKIIDPVLNSLIIISNIIQLTLIVLVAELDLLIFSKVALKYLIFLPPISLIRRLKMPIILIVVCILIIIISTGLIYKSGISKINHKILRKIKDEIFNISKSISKISIEYSNISIFRYISNYGEVSIIYIRCGNYVDRVFGLGNITIIYNCSNVGLLKAFKIVLNYNVSSEIYCKYTKHRNITYVVCHSKSKLRPIIYRRYLVGLLHTNCSKVSIKFIDNITLIVRKHLNASCSVNIVGPFSGSENVQYSNVQYSKIEILRKILYKIYNVDKIVNYYYNKSVVDLRKILTLIQTIDNLKYYTVRKFILHRDVDSIYIHFPISRAVLWPVNISTIPYSKSIYTYYRYLINVKSECSNILKTFNFYKYFNNIIIISLYSLFLTIFSIIAAMYILTNILSLEGIVIYPLIKFGKILLSEFLIPLYFKIASKAVSKKFIRSIYRAFKKSEGIVILDNYHRVENVLKTYHHRYRVEGLYTISNYARRRLSKYIDRRVLYEIENRRMPILYLKNLDIKKKDYQTKIIIEDIMKNLGISIELLSDFSIRRFERLDRLSKYVLSTYINVSRGFRYYNIIDLSIDMRLTPYHILLLSLDRDVITNVLRRLNLYDMFKDYLDVNRDFIFSKFRTYIYDLYYASLLTSRIIHRRVTGSIILSLLKYSDLDRSLYVREVKNILRYHIDFDVVKKILDEYLREVYTRYSGSFRRRELYKVNILRRLFNV